MPDRFGRTPGWIRTTLFYVSIVAYALLTLVGVIAFFWPAGGGLSLVELVIGRTAGGVIAATALTCLASYPTHRWRWEMHGTWGLGIAVTFLAGVIVSADADSARGLLALFAILVVLGVYIRALQILLFAHQTTGAALRQIAWRRSGRPSPLT